jgi:hypothetical protein
MKITDVRTCLVGSLRKNWPIVRVATNEGVRSLDLVEPSPITPGTVNGPRTIPGNSAARRRRAQG